MFHLKGPSRLKIGQRLLFWLLAFVLLLLILWRPWGQNRTSSDESWIKNVGGLKADLTLKGIRYARNLGGKTQWILWADEGRLYEAKNIMDLKDVKIKFFPAAGGQLLITGNSGVYRINDDEMSLKGNVEVHSESGTSLYSKSLYFSQKKRLIWTKDNVIIKGNGLTMRGKGLEYNLQIGKLTVINQTSILPENGDLNL
ncbi:MAG: LPS export ABC transporter periplasmic protein LptC [Nitrospiraceae bacterium]|nr:LPS export ABC transporter periplasmic protein LptC [Nitrospiraceae bacterium]